MADSKTPETPPTPQTPPDPPTQKRPPEEGPKMVPLERLSEVVADRNRLRDELAEAKAEAQRLTETAATASTLASELETWKKKASDAEDRFKSFAEVSKRGIGNPEIVEAITAHWAGLPTKDRPELGALLDSWRPTEEKPDALKDAPLLLRPHLAAAWQPGKGQPKQKPGVGGGHSGGAYQPPPGRSDMSVEQLQTAFSDALGGKMGLDDLRKLLGSS